jgi:hypothetical protein
MTTFKTNHGGGSTASIIEMPSYKQQDPSKVVGSMDPIVRTVSNRSHENGRTLHETAGELPTVLPPTEVIPEWNHPRINMYRTGAAFWSFIVLGMNDAAYGVCEGLSFHAKFLSNRLNRL